MLSMDMRKAFDTIDHLALVQALRSRGLPESYVSLLSLLLWYSNGVNQWKLKIPNPTRGQTKRNSQRDSIQLRLGRCIR